MVQRHSIGAMPVRWYTFGVLSDGNARQNLFRHMGCFNPQNRLPSSGENLPHQTWCGRTVTAYRRRNDSGV